MAQPAVITFDVYGTLVRWDETVSEAFGDLLTPSGGSAAAIACAAEIFEAESRRRQTLGAFRSYREILRDSVAPALAAAGHVATSADADHILARIARIPPFADVPPVLAALSGRHRLSPISNTDDDLLAGTLDGLGNVFYTAVTAEQAQAYKPNPGLFRFALAKLGVAPADHLHVAQGTFSDLAVCTALGLRVVWVNRTKATLQKGLEPLAIIDDLSGLADVIAAL